MALVTLLQNTLEQLILIFLHFNDIVDELLVRLIGSFCDDDCFGRVFWWSRAELAQLFGSIFQEGLDCFEASDWRRSDFIFTGFVNLVFFEMDLSKEFRVVVVKLFWRLDFVLIANFESFNKLVTNELEQRGYFILLTGPRCLRIVVFSLNDRSN